MKRLAFGLFAVAALLFGATMVMSAPGDLVRTNNAGNQATGVPVIPGTPCWRIGNQTFRPEGTPFAACTPATTTTLPATTTVAPTTTAAPTTTVAPTTTLPGGVQFFEDFNDGTGLENFDLHVFHRNVDLFGYSGLSGGSWRADHDTACNGPDTFRTMSWNGTTNQANRIANSFYVCGQTQAVGNGHMMTTMGDVDGYSVVSFSPNAVFPDVNQVCFDVNLTNLGNRKWWKVGIVSESLYNSTVNGVPGYLVSDVAASDLPGQLVGSDRFFVSWSGGFSGGLDGGVKIGNQQTGAHVQPNRDDKATRYPICVTDNGNNTVSFSGPSINISAPGSFPNGPLRVVIQDHNYTPNKSESYRTPVNPYTWHWDNILVR